MMELSAILHELETPTGVTPSLPLRSQYRDCSASHHNNLEARLISPGQNGQDKSAFVIGETVYSTKSLPRNRLLFLSCGLCVSILLAAVVLNAFLLAASSMYTLADLSSELVRSPLPIPCHSHNDYWRKIPVFSALHVGCIGVEADVWLEDGELFVGHSWSSLRQDRTFTSLYVEPLLEILRSKNAANGSLSSSPRGLYDTDPSQTVVLLIDLKTDAASTWPVVVKQLGPLREGGWLSYTENGNLTTKPITVVATGNSQFGMVSANGTYRDAFFDAPLDSLADSPYNQTNSYYTSVSFKRAIGFVRFGRMSDAQVQLVRRQVAQAHSLGLKARYWGLPGWPTSVRNHVWEVLRAEGVDILNVDDLEGAKEFLGRSRISKGIID